MTNQKLEEIFCKDGKFVDEKNNEIHPQPIGNPMFIADVNKTFIKNKLMREQKKFIKRFKINAYTSDQPHNYYEKTNDRIVSCIPFQLYKK